MAKLVIYPGTPDAQEVTLKNGVNHIGRAISNDVTLEDPSVSSSHCVIVVNGSTVLFRDKGSPNGSFVDHKPITEGMLAAGQTLQLGSLEMMFDDDASAPR